MHKPSSISDQPSLSSSKSILSGIESKSKSGANEIMETATTINQKTIQSLTKESKLIILQRVADIHGGSFSFVFGSYEPRAVAVFPWSI